MSADNYKHRLRYLTLKGFKSFKDTGSLRLESGLNVLIGANGSGKSNFIGFFEMLSHMMDTNLGLQNYVASKANRAESFLFRGSAVTPRFEAKLEFALNTFEFALAASEDGSLFFTKEKASFNGPYLGLSNYDKGSGHLESRMLSTAWTAGEKFTVETTQKWRVYHFHNTSPKAPMMLPTNAVGSTRLNGDASNIADFLHQMREKNRPYYDRIVSHIRQVAPFFGDFVLEPDSNEQIRLLWKEHGQDTVYFPSQFSDGTIRFACLATLLLQPDPPATLIIDEPELGLHPQAIMVLAGMLRLAEENCQIIVSTQSSALVDYLDIEELLVVDRKDGASVIKRPDEDEYKAWLEDYSLSDIWNKNLMGGRPE
jgi:predicted ATPase